MPFADDITVARVSAVEVRRAYDVLTRIDGSLTVGAKQMGLAIACAESNLGLFPPLTGPDGEPSHNWGALVYTGPAQAPPFAGSPGFVIAHDHDAAGNLTTMKFAAFPTAEIGAQHFLSTWLRHADTRAAANSGNASSTAAAMFKHGYYTGTCKSACGVACPEAITLQQALAACPASARIESYTKFIMGLAPRVAAALRQPLAVGRGAIAQPRSIISGSGGIFVPLLGAAATAFLVRKFFL